MAEEVAIDKKQLTEIRDLLKACLERLNFSLADIGCVHANAIDVTTMGGGNTKIQLCPDCGETIESEINYEELGLRK